MSQSKAPIVNVIVATAGSQRTIAAWDNAAGEYVIPWKCKEDLQHFKRSTVGNGNNAVIMGHNTWLSLPVGCRPLKGRMNIVVTRMSIEQLPGAEDSDVLQVATTLSMALQWCRDVSQHKPFDEVFIIGGAHIYRQCFEDDDIMRQVDFVYLTEISTSLCSSDHVASSLDHPYDRKRPLLTFPEVPDKWFEVTFTHQLSDAAKLIVYQATNKEEQKYLDLLQSLLRVEVPTPNRTNVDAFCKFAQTLSFDLSAGHIPLLTTKRVFFRGSLEEMLFFISGSTDTHVLRDKGVHIWDQNTSREFLDSRGLRHYHEGDMGPTYSFLMRYAGQEANYHGKRWDYSQGGGVDQLQTVVDGIRTDPFGRRHMINLWSPKYLYKMSLPPCLFNYIFYVDVQDGSVSLMATMRSADVFLGVPFNLSGASILLRIVCHLTDRPPGELVLQMANCHLYVDHLDQARKQLERKPRMFPKLFLRRSAAELQYSVHNLAAEDFCLVNYKPQGTLKAAMAV